MFHNWPIWALGAMSGTSLDGVDAAMVLTDGERVLDFGPSDFMAYTDAQRGVFRAALGRWPDDSGVDAARALTEDVHYDILKRFDRPGEIPRTELIGFHGQTLAHDPHGQGTHQTGNGTLLADRLNIPVAWDFRSADVAAGGEGAPLAPFFHHACARWAGLKTPVAFLNLGGVGNITWVDPTIPDPAMPGALLAFDTGPANAPINDLMERGFGQPFDKDGAVAMQGRAAHKIVKEVMAHPYFSKAAPKSLDRDEFTDSLQPVETLNSVADSITTLVEIIAESVALGCHLCSSFPTRLLVSGGGRHNPAIMAALTRRTGAQVEPVEAIGLNGDMLEAQAFAYLAVRVARGLPLSSPLTTGVHEPMQGGKLDFPKGLS